MSLSLVTWKDVITDNGNHQPHYLSLQEFSLCVFRKYTVAIYIPAQLNRSWTADISNEADDIEQMQDKVASTYHTCVFAY